MASAQAAPGPATGALTRLSAPLLRKLADLSVGKKLLLIYLLDLCTVVFISGILIHEKFIAIDFSRKELSGTAYIEALRPALMDVGPQRTDAVRRHAAQRRAWPTPKRRFGAGHGQPSN